MSRQTLSSGDPVTDWPDQSIARQDHWDLMLEDGNSLITFELLFPFSPGQAGEVRQLPDHRLAYLEYEGRISGGRGTVERVISGRFDWLKREQSRMVASLKGNIEAVLELSLELSENTQKPDASEQTVDSKWNLNWNSPGS